MAGDIHFFCGYPVFGLKSRGDMDSHFWLKMVVEHIPRKELDELNHFRDNSSKSLSCSHENGGAHADVGGSRCWQVRTPA
jgi:hypothetical protein